MKPEIGIKPPKKALNFALKLHNAVKLSAGATQTQNGCLRRLVFQQPLEQAYRG